MSEGAEFALSVVLPTRNGQATIAQQLDALVHQQTSARWELIVVDNGSTDQTLVRVDEFSHGAVPVRVVDASARAGLSYARNRGVSAAASRFVAFCDDDDEVSPGWVARLVEALTEHPFVASEMEYERLNTSASMAGRARFQQDSLPEMFGFTVANGAIAIDRRLWNAVGGNDESLRKSGEDFDFAIRVQQQCGVEPRLAIGAIYHYRQRSGLRASFRQGRSYGRAHVMLYSRYGRGNVTLKSERRRAIRDWWWLASRAPLCILGTRREPWGRRLGVRTGRVLGSLEHRCWYP